MPKQPIVKSLLVITSLGLAALIFFCAFPGNFILGHGQVCQLNAHLITIPSSKEILLLGFTAILLVLVGLALKSSSERVTGPVYILGSSLFSEFFNNLHPTSAFVLARTTQRKVY